MADILIRGMEMPKSCFDCIFENRFFGKIGCNNLPGMFANELNAIAYTTERNPFCPLIPLPEGHGDLIDLDAFRAENGMNAKCEHCPTNTYKCQYDMIHTKMEFCEMLDDAPVIVPAEGGGEK